MIDGIFMLNEWTATCSCLKSYERFKSLIKEISHSLEKQFRVQA